MVTSSQGIRTLDEKFRGGLTAAQRARLKWHAEHGTTILCGQRAAWFIDGKGGG